MIYIKIYKCLCVNHGDQRVFEYLSYHGYGSAVILNSFTDTVRGPTLESELLQLSATRNYGSR